LHGTNLIAWFIAAGWQRREDGGFRLHPFRRLPQISEKIKKKLDKLLASGYNKEADFGGAEII